MDGAGGAGLCCCDASLAPGQRLGRRGRLPSRPSFAARQPRTPAGPRQAPGHRAAAGGGGRLHPHLLPAARAGRELPARRGRGRHGGGAGRLVRRLGAVSAHTAAAGLAPHRHHCPQQGPHRRQPGRLRARQVPGRALAGRPDPPARPGQHAGAVADGAGQRPAAGPPGGPAGADRAGHGGGRQDPGLPGQRGAHADRADRRVALHGLGAGCADPRGPPPGAAGRAAGAPGREGAHARDARVRRRHAGAVAAPRAPPEAKDAAH